MFSRLESASLLDHSHFLDVMRKNFVAMTFMLIWAVLLTVSLLWGFYYDWPDFVHIDYGFPLTWATNTLSTIAGSANLWEVNLTFLLTDLLLWLSIGIAGVGVIVYKVGN